MFEHEAYLSLGSNIGDRLALLQAAIAYIMDEPNINLVAVSSVYETEPVDYLQQPEFLNIVCCIHTRLSPEDLLRFTQGVESNLGRRRTILRGPRTIDIDILCYDDIQMHTECLTIPHPRMMERAFVIIPLRQIAPHLDLPQIQEQGVNYFVEIEPIRDENGLSLEPTQK